MPMMPETGQDDKPAVYPQLLRTDFDLKGGLQYGEQKMIKCVLVGDCHGKTTLVQTFVSGFPQMEYDPTIEDSYQVEYKVDEKLYLLSILDVNGFQEYSPLRAQAYPEVDIFLLCFGVMQSSGLEHVRDVWLPEIRGPCPNAPFLLIGLKADLRDKMPEPWDSPVAKGKAISTAVELGAIKYIECSSLLQHGLQEVFGEALLAGIEVAAARAEQPSVALARPLRARTLSGSILDLSRKIFDFRERLQSRRQPGRLQSVPEETTEASVEEDTQSDSERQPMLFTQLARASIDFEETLSRTWVYTHLDRRALLRTSSIRDNATYTSKIRSSQLTITPSNRSMLSVPMSWTSGDRHSIASWGSAERNATATLEIIEQYAATLESLQTDLFDTSIFPQTSQSWNHVSAEGHANVQLGNTYRHVTNNYVINYNLIIVSDAAGLTGTPAPT